MSHVGFKVIEIDGIKHREYTTGTIKYIAPPQSRHEIINKSPTHPCVYLVTDTTNNKKYVGSAVHMRKRAHRYLGKNSSDYKKLLFRHLNPSLIKIEILESCEGMSISDLRILELAYIEGLNTKYPYGYNQQNPVTLKPFTQRTIND